MAMIADPRRFRLMPSLSHFHAFMPFLDMAYPLPPTGQ
jgi:hypothetical protein